MDDVTKAQLIFGVILLIMAVPLKNWLFTIIGGMLLIGSMPTVLGASKETKDIVVYSLIGAMIIPIIYIILYLAITEIKVRKKAKKDMDEHLKKLDRARDILKNQNPMPIKITPTVVIDQKPINQIIELTPEEKVAQLEKNAALAERTAAALLRTREADRSLERAAYEDAVEKVRRLQKVERENNPPRTPPPMTPEEKVEAIEDLKKRENLQIEKLRKLGHEEKSNAIDNVRASYEKELKKLLDSTRSAK